MVIHLHSSTQLTIARGVTSTSYVHLNGVHEDIKWQTVQERTALFLAIATSPCRP